MRKAEYFWDANEISFSKSEIVCNINEYELCSIDNIEYYFSQDGERKTVIIYDEQIITDSYAKIILRYHVMNYIFTISAICKMHGSDCSNLERVCNNFSKASVYISY